MKLSCGSRSIEIPREEPLRPEMNYVKLMRQDTGLEEAAEIKTAMMDREGWRDRARRTSGSPTG